MERTSSFKRHGGKMKIEETLREDGLRVISCRTPSSKKVQLELSAGVGSAYDPPEKQGQFHYFEHMAFKGTEKRSLAELQSFQKRHVIDWNAWTGSVRTKYSGSAVYKKLPGLCDLFCDLYFRSIFPAEEIEREKEVIINEITHAYDNESYLAFFALWKHLWRENPLRTLGMGTPEGVRKVTREDLRSEQEKWYIPSNTVVLGLGNLWHADLVGEINKHALFNARKAVSRSWDDEYGQLPLCPKIMIERPELERAVVLIGGKLPMNTDEKTDLEVMFLEHLLIKESSSILWNEIREKRGLAYSVSGELVDRQPLGNFFYVEVETLPSRIDEVIELIFREMQKPLNDPKKLEDLKDWFIDWNSLEFEGDLDAWSNLIQKSINRGQPLQPLERYFSRQRKIAASISLEDIEALRTTFFKPEQFVTVIVGPPA